MIHRDLKPSNIFLSEVAGDRLLVKILDFGIAKGLDEDARLTQNGVMIGSSGYMAPEQIHAAAEVDHRADIYALGGILYFLLTGQPAYKGKTTRAVLAKQLAELPEPIDFDQLGKPEARDLQAVILTAMDPDPARRYQSAEELMQALRAGCGLDQPGTTSRKRRQLLLLESEKGSRTTREEKAAPTQASADDSRDRRVAAADPPAESKRWWPLALVAVGGLTVLGAVVGALAALRPNDAPPRPQPPGQPAADRNGGKPSADDSDPPPPRPRPTARGVTENEVVLGMSAAFSGPSRELGRGMQLGISTYLQRVNAEGGVNGRKLRLVALDDGYDPARALANMKLLNDEHRAFAVIGNVGTPTAEATLPYALDKRLPFLGAFTGAKLLRRDPPDRYVFNFRASYAEETAAMVRYLVDVKKLRPDQIAVFAQKDGYGDAGFAGVAKALRAHGRDPEQILRVGYERNTADVDAAVEEMLKHKAEVKAVVMVPSYRAAARFIQKLRDAKMDVLFLNVSFVGSDALAEELRQMGLSYAEGVIVTQVVPHFDSKSTAVLKYRADLKKYYPSEQPSFISLEGYLAAALFVEGIRKAGDSLNEESLVDALESLRNLDVGVGAPATFTPSEHQGSHKVWGTRLDATGHYQILDLD
jgi:ABC-type branched-subunit amino acid transport system substrate-binding protein